MQNKKSAVFILSHGRPNNVLTHKALRKHGYSGEIYIILDDEDIYIDEYKKIYKDKIIVFKKKEYQGKFDIMDNFDGNKVIVYARNACYDIARELGLDYFFEYEDDYGSFQHKFLDGNSLKWAYVNNLDKIMSLMITALDETSFKTIAFAQGGDFIGGEFLGNQYKRKAMNTFLFKVNKDKKDDMLFIGRMNDDVNTYLTQGMVGVKILQISDIMITQKATQSNKGGNTEAYKEFGTYTKSFYSVIAQPSACKISIIGVNSFRIHHKINWKLAVPKILKEKYKKK